MKKYYAPSSEIVELTSERIICGSGSTNKYNGEQDAEIWFEN